MRTRLVYEEPVSSGDDALGEPIVVWTRRFDLWARVRPIDGKEAPNAERTTAVIRHEVTCRHRPDLAPVGRFRIKGTDRILNIESIVDWEERRVELTISAVERIGE